MGRTKKRHRAWKQQMRSRARKRRGYGYRWDDDISPGRLVAWAEPERKDKHGQTSSGASSYYNRVQPANPAAPTRRIEREEPRTYLDVTSDEVREIQKINRQVDLMGQAITALVIALGALVLVYNVARWLCGY